MLPYNENEEVPLATAHVYIMADINNQTINYLTINGEVNHEPEHFKNTNIVTLCLHCTLQLMKTGLFVQKTGSSLFQHLSKWYYSS